MSDIIRHKFNNGNEVEIRIFENDPSGETADILIKCLESTHKPQRFLCKIVPLDQTTLILELRNDVTGEVKGDEAATSVPVAP